MKYRKILAVTSIAVASTMVVAVHSSRADGDNKFDKRLERSTKVLLEILNSPRVQKSIEKYAEEHADTMSPSDAAAPTGDDQSQNENIFVKGYEKVADADAMIPPYLVEKARCIAVIPGLFKAGLFNFGGMYGAGVATCKTMVSDDSWSMPSFVKIEGGTWGEEFGGESTDAVLVFMDDDASLLLGRDSFHLGGDVSVAAGPVGRDAYAGTNLHLQAKVLSYSHTRGAYIGATITGAGMIADTKANRGFYGKNSPSPEELLWTPLAQSGSKEANQGLAELAAALGVDVGQAN